MAAVTAVTAAAEITAAAIMAVTVVMAAATVAEITAETVEAMAVTTWKPIRPKNKTRIESFISALSPPVVRLGGLCCI